MICWTGLHQTKCLIFHSKYECNIKPYLTCLILIILNEIQNNIAQEKMFHPLSCCLRIFMLSWGKPTWVHIRNTGNWALPQVLGFRKRGWGCALTRTFVCPYLRPVSDVILQNQSDFTDFRFSVFFALTPIQLTIGSCANHVVST